MSPYISHWGGKQLSFIQLCLLVMLQHAQWERSNLPDMSDLKYKSRLASALILLQCHLLTVKQQVAQTITAITQNHCPNFYAACPFPCSWRAIITLNAPWTRSWASLSGMCCLLFLFVMAKARTNYFSDLSTSLHLVCWAALTGGRNSNECEAVDSCCMTVTLNSGLLWSTDAGIQCLKGSVKSNWEKQTEHIRTEYSKWGTAPPLITTLQIQEVFGTAELANMAKVCKI